MPTTARPHCRDTGRTAGRRPYVSGGPKCFVRYIFWGRAYFQTIFSQRSASGAIECRLRFDVTRIPPIHPAIEAYVWGMYEGVFFCKVAIFNALERDVLW